MVLLAKVRSFVKGQHVYDGNLQPGDYAECQRDENNAFSENAWEICKGGLLVGHIPETLAEVLSDLLDQGRVDTVTCKITGYRQPAEGGTWVPGGGIVVPCTYKIYGRNVDRDVVRNSIETAEYHFSDVA